MGVWPGRYYVAMPPCHHIDSYYDCIDVHEFPDAIGPVVELCDSEPPEPAANAVCMV